MARPRIWQSPMERRTAVWMVKNGREPPLVKRGAIGRYRKLLDWYYKNKLGVKNRQARTGIVSRLIKEKLKTRGLQRELGEVSTVDPLTNLHTRSYFLGELKVRRAETGVVAREPRRYARPFGVLYLDLNDFKRINDRQGHAVGDRALKLFSKVIRKSIRSGDLAGRLGGDEFAILVNGNVQDMKRLAARIHKNLGKARVGRTRLSTSIGIAQFDPETSRNVLRAAEKAMYNAKDQHKAGKKNVTFIRRTIPRKPVAP